LHVVCGAVHILSAITILAVGISSIKTARVVTVVALRNVSALHIEDANTVSLLPLLVLCSVVSGSAHFLLALQADDVIEATLGTGVNPYRWGDYAISSPMMVVVIALVSGVVDVWSLWGMAAMQSLLMVVSGYTEGSSTLALTSLMAAYYAVTVWGPIFHAVAAQPNIPEFVGFIIATLFLLFASFGVVYVVAMRTARKMHTELAYCVLSVAAKLSLQWLVYGGADSLDGESEGQTIGIVLCAVFVVSIVVAVSFSCTMPPT
jgi:hypothetical protein